MSSSSDNDAKLGPMPAVSTQNSSQALEHSRSDRIIRPDGRKIHVANTPADANALRLQLSKTDQESNDFDVVLKGSPEHLAVLEETRKHHTELRESLRLKLGDDFDHFERVKTELDHLSAELHNLSHHAVSLDANFGRYGYSAHIRTIPPSGDKAEASPFGSANHQDRDWNEPQQGEYMKFFKRPTLRQYNHKGLLWRSSDGAEVSSYELFVDLLYVGILAVAGETAVEAANAKGFLQFAITFIMTWKLWSDLSIALSWFVMDDIIRRISILFMLVLLLGLVTNMEEIFHETYTPLVAFYLAGRWYSGLYYFWMAYLIPIVRNSLIGSGLLCIIPGFLWIGSIHVEFPVRNALIWPAIAIDLLGPIIFVGIQTGLAPMPLWLSKKAKKTFEYMPGLNIEHRIERTNAFVSLVFGVAIISIIYQSAVAFGINAFFGKAVLGLITTFMFNWLYFEIDVFNMHTHAIRHSFLSSSIWTLTHLPLIMSFTLAAATLAKLTVAHDVHAATLTDLSPATSARLSEDHVPAALRLFYCIGLATALACTGLVALTHRVRALPRASAVRLTKPVRVACRFAASLAIGLLALTHEEQLDSLQLVAVTTCIVVAVVILELAGSTCTGGGFWGFGYAGKSCSYEAFAATGGKDLEHRAGEEQDENDKGNENGNEKVRVLVEEVDKRGHAQGASNQETIV